MLQTSLNGNTNIQQVLSRRMSLTEDSNIVHSTHMTDSAGDARPCILFEWDTQESSEAERMNGLKY